MGFPTLPWMCNVVTHREAKSLILNVLNLQCSAFVEPIEVNYQDFTSSC